MCFIKNPTPHAGNAATDAGNAATDAGRTRRLSAGATLPSGVSEAFILQTKLKTG